MISQPLTISYMPINVTSTVWSSIWVLVSNDLLYFVGEFCNNVSIKTSDASYKPHLHSKTRPPTIYPKEICLRKPKFLTILLPN